MFCMYILMINISYNYTDFAHNTSSWQVNIVPNILLLELARDSTRVVSGLSPLYRSLS